MGDGRWRDGTGKRGKGDVLPEETTGEHRGGSEGTKHCHQFSVGMKVVDLGSLGT